MKRICIECKSKKDLKLEFVKNKDMPSGYLNLCKLCYNKRLRRYKQLKPEQYREYHRRYRAKPEYLFKSYRDGAKRRGLEFSITYDFFIDTYWNKPCEYCGDVIQTVGLDRVDNKRGYSKDNILPCCYTCNLMKLKSTKKDFIKKCRKIARHQSGKNVNEHN